MAMVNLNRKCHGLAATLGIDHETLRDIAGVASLKELTPRQWNQLYNHLLNEYIKVNGASKEQIKKIYKLGYKVLKKETAWICGFVKKQLGYSKNVERLSRKEATKVITGMEKVVRWKNEQTAQTEK